MLKHIDRLLVQAYFKAYFVCLISLLSLYVVVDMFTNLDDFTHHKSGLFPVLKRIGTFYGYQLPLIFDRLCEPIVLLAGMFTIAWMQRNNELMPLLSAGVSTRRVVLPVLISGCAMLLLAVVNQELVLPRFASKLMQPRDDQDGEKEILNLAGAYDQNDMLLSGTSAIRKGMIVKEFMCVIKPPVSRGLLTVTAKEAHYLPAGSGKYQKGWLLIGTTPKGPMEGQEVLEFIDEGKYFLKTETADFEAVVRSRKWFNLASTLTLYRELERSHSRDLASMAVGLHSRFTRTILGMILVFMGLSVILRDQNRNVFISAGLCLVLCGVFFAAGFLCKHLGSAEILPPALAAWLPVMCFGPLAVVMFDAVHT